MYIGETCIVGTISTTPRKIKFPKVELNNKRRIITLGKKSFVPQNYANLMFNIICLNDTLKCL